MLLKLVFSSAFLCQMMGSVKTEMDKRCKTGGQICPCCEENKCDYNRQCMTGCKDGYWGGRCYNICPAYCTRCGRQFGNRYFGTYQKCYKCADGFFSGKGVTNCSTPCPETCNQTLCDATNGKCSNGCINENINGDMCDQCIKGKFGSNCSFSCPRNCNFSVCSRTEGKCTYGCVSNVFEGDECNTCVVGKYGNRCEKSCPNNCEDNLCLKTNGTCINGCKGNFAGEVCNRCKDGYFGNNCTKKCLSSCLHGICNFTSGVCNECPVGRFGSNCDRRCHSNCLDNRCNQYNGKCERCYEGYYGDYCDQRCGKCMNDTCHQASSQCLHGCMAGYSGFNCINEIEEEAGGSVIATVVGSVSAVIVIVTAVTTVLWYIRRSQASESQEQGPVYENALAVKASQRRRKRRAEGDNIELSLELQEDDHQFDTDLPENEDDYYNTSGASENIRISDLFEHVSSKGPNYFKQEFQEIPKSFEYPCSVAMKEENIEKNRYNGIYPYDHSRVKISGQSDFFINACYIDGFRKEKAYIASLGPTRSTMEDFVTFWEMVWYEKADIIVMLTNLEEATGMKCGQYWPQLEITQSYGDVAVKCRSEETFAEYTVRTFTLSKKTKTRTLTQLHYTAWPDKGVPDSVTSLIEFRQRVKSFQNMTGGPTIVHCSAGVGRTGTYIAIDRLTEEGQNEDFISVVDCVTSMRQQRVNMVQTEEQYLYVYRALVHSLTFGCDAIPADTFQEYVEPTSKVLFVSKFTQLSRQIEEESAEETEAMNINKQYIDKNRIQSDIPGNRNRPRLNLNRTSNESDYINAVYMNSFKTKNYFILAQTPLPTTVQDFLCLIYQENVSCIVAMDDIRAKGMDVGTYIAANSQTPRHGKFTVITTKCASTHQYTVRKLVIQNSGQQRPGTKTIYHFQYAGWKIEDSIPSDAEDFVQFVKAVEIKENELQAEEPRILIHCLDGAERSALFCAISILLEKMDVEGQVSVVNTLRQVRARRKAAIPNVEQFEFCHRCISTHLEMFSTYTNFAMTSK